MRRASTSEIGTSWRQHAPHPFLHDPSLRAGTIRGKADEAVRDPLKNRQERLQPRRCRGEGQLHLDFVVPDLHSHANFHQVHEMPAIQLNV